MIGVGLSMKNTQNIKNYLAVSAAVITFGVYLASLQNSFIATWDDGEYVLNNIHIHSLSLAFLRWAFLDFYASNWLPLTWISYALDYVLWGLNPLGYHLTNNILHAANTFIVVHLVVRLHRILKETDLGSRASSFLSERTMLITGGVTGLLFGLHPVHVESVAWIAERKDLLCALFFLLSITMYTRYVELTGEWTAQKKWPRPLAREYLLSLGFFILALLSKPMAVSLPVVLLILDWYPFRRIQTLKTFQTVFVEKLPLVALSVISSILTILAQKAGGAIVEIQTIPLSSRLLVAAQSLVAYLWKMAIPRDLIPFYPYPKNISYTSIEFLFAIALVIGITLCCIMISKKQKVWLTAWGYYAVTLLPVLGIVQVGSQSMADRYTYLPSLAPFLIIGMGASWVYDRLMINRQRLKLMVAMFVLCAGIAIFGCLSFLTIRQIQIWKDGLSLWSYVIEKEPQRASIAYTNLGLVYQKKGQLGNALENYEKAIALDHKDYLAYNNRGTIFDKLGQFDKAIQSYDEAVTLKPDDYRAYFNRALANDKIGRLSEAIEDLQRAARLQRGNPLIHHNLGVLYGKAGIYDRSIAAFDTAIALEPNNPVRYNNRGIAYAFSNQYTKAIEDFSRAILLDENYGSAYFYRGDAYFKTGATVLALSDFSKGCNLGDRNSCNALQVIRMSTPPGQKR